MESTLKQLSLSADELRERLSNVSPLQASKVLIETELYDRKDSLEVLNQIYEEFESKSSLIDSLVNPMLLSVADGLIKHPKLNGSFRKTNITPSRLVNEVNNFQYERSTQKAVDDDQFLTQAEKTYYNNEKLGIDKDGKKYNKAFHRNKFYDTKSRGVTESDKGIVRDQTVIYTKKNGEQESKTTAVVIDDITGEKLDLTKEGAAQKGISSADMDHVDPINHIRSKYKNNPYLYRDDLEQLIGMAENESYINSSLNQSKGDMTWSEYIEEYPDALTEDEKARALELESKAKKAQNKAAAKAMAKNIGLKGLGDIIVLLLKPIWFEIKDMFQNGVLHGFNTDDKIEAFLLRLKRVGKFIKDNVLKTLGDALKDVIGNFIPMLISSIANIFVGMFKKILQIISDGFIAIKEAFKILLKPDSEISPAQKADAITKVIASAVVPILIFAFEESILTGLKFLDGTPFEFLKDVAMIILSGLATTVVVWLLDQIDIFSVKEEKRRQRIEEVFDMRIAQIKENTDLFEKEALEKLVQDKLKFKVISEQTKESILQHGDVRSAVDNVADFLQVKLSTKHADEFLELLQSNETLAL